MSCPVTAKDLELPWLKLSLLVSSVLPQVALDQGTSSPMAKTGSSSRPRRRVSSLDCEGRSASVRMRETGSRGGPEQLPKNGFKSVRQFGALSKRWKFPINSDLEGIRHSDARPS